VSTRVKVPSLTVAEVEAAIDRPQAAWAHQCHAVSLEIVRSGVLGQPARVARGSCKGVGGQHSWVVLGEDCYAPRARLLDATLWSYVEGVDVLWRGTYADRLHRPHGYGRIWEWGQPEAGDGPPIELAVPLSRVASSFLELLGPLDRLGWARLSGAPVGGWPAGEVFAAMSQTPELSALVPIDVLGMTTDLNPSGLYR
jgi:hypothetical protein